jgi:hypothetical protein
METQMAVTVAAQTRDFARCYLQMILDLGRDDWVAASEAFERTLSAHPDHPYVAYLRANPARRAGFSATAERVREEEFPQIQRRKAGTRRNAPVFYRVGRQPSLSLHLPYDVPSSHPLRTAESAGGNPLRRQAKTQEPRSPWRRRLGKQRTGQDASTGSRSSAAWWRKLAGGAAAGPTTLPPILQGRSCRLPCPDRHRSDGETCMNEVLAPDRSAVRRLGAERYLRHTLIWFAVTVIAVRWSLAVTGYPRLASGELHIAHVLWGGLALFGAALAPLLFANRWALEASAVLAGIGVGLFIDEVGKFITQANDYFFPPAAPIIYASFLLTLLLYLRVRNEPERSVRHDLYGALDRLPLVLDHDLDARRHAELRELLVHARDHAQDRKLARLAAALLEVVESEYVELTRRPRSPWERFADRLRAFEARWLTLGRMRLLFAAVLLAMGAGAFVELLVLLWTAILPLDLERAVRIIARGADAPGGTRLFLLFSRFVLAGIVGMLLVLGSVLLALGRIRQGIACGYFGLLLSLTIHHLLVFYFDQFGAVGGVLLDFAVLLGLLHYRRRQNPAGNLGGQTPNRRAPARLALADQHHAGADRRGAGVDP